MPRAIEFVEAHDKDLWFRLIEHSLKNEAFLSDLLDHAGVYDVDLARLVAEIPKGMHIPRLRDKVVKIISDYRFQVRSGVYTHGERRPVPVLFLQGPGGGGVLAR